MKEKLNSTVIAVTLGLFIGVASVAVDKSEQVRTLQQEVESLKHEVEIRDERILDIQTTCRTYEDEIIKLYGGMYNDENNN